MKYSNRDYILGLDCSHWQESIDWGKAKAEGIQFAYVKITQGQIHFEGNFYPLKSRIQEIKKHGIKLGYYHFCSPGTGRPESQAKSEAANLNLHLKNLPEFDLPIMLDIEEFVKGSKWTSKDLTLYLQTFISEINHEIIIYTNKWIWTDDVNFKIYPLWVPFYGTGLMDIPKGWTDWTIWQFTETGQINGVEGMVDLNWMKKEYFEKYRFSS
jgi:lysozyme